MRLPALALAGALALSLNQMPGTPQAPAVRFHHLHFQTDDFAAALTAAAGTFGGVRTNVLQGTVHLLLFIVYVALIFSP